MFRRLFGAFFCLFIHVFAVFWAIYEPFLSVLFVRVFAWCVFSLSFYCFVLFFPIFEANISYERISCSLYSECMRFFFSCCLFTYFSCSFSYGSYFTCIICIFNIYVCFLLLSSVRYFSLFLFSNWYTFKHSDNIGTKNYNEHTETSLKSWVVQ